MIKTVRAMQLEGIVAKRTDSNYEDGELRFAARTRAGLVPHIRRQFARSLKPLRIDQCPFVDLPTEGSSRWGGGVSAEDMKEMNWTKLEIVVEIPFVEWTGENRLRLSKYLGLRPDKQAKDVRRET